MPPRFVTDWAEENPEKAEKIGKVIFHPAISPVNHGLIVSLAVVAGYWGFSWLEFIPHAKTFGAGVGFGGGMFFYTDREIGDLTRFVFGKPWRLHSTQIKTADSWLDWIVPLIFGLATVHLLLA
jgi:hypothetical protein